MGVKLVNERTEVVVINGNLKLPDLTAEGWSQFRMANCLEWKGDDFAETIIMSKDKFLSYKNTRITVMGHVDCAIKLKP
jgi:hypothetical protein